MILLGGEGVVCLQNMMVASLISGRKTSSLTGCTSQPYRLGEAGPVLWLGWTGCAAAGVGWETAGSGNNWSDGAAVPLTAGAVSG